ncbi:hypothetical protein BOX15_Mlig005689g2, partial [Macrostomum lignano]
ITDYFATQKKSARSGRPGNKKAADSSVVEVAAEPQVSLSPPKRLLRSGRKVASPAASSSRKTPVRSAAASKSKSSARTRNKPLVIAQLIFDDVETEPEVDARKDVIIDKEVIAAPKEALKKPEVAVKEPEVAVKELEVAVKEPEVVVKEPEVVVKEPEVAVKEPEVVSSKAEVAISKLKKTVSEPETVKEVAKPKIAIEPEVAAKTRPTASRSVIKLSKPKSTVQPETPAKPKVPVEPEVAIGPEVPVEPVKAASILASRAKELPLPSDLDVLRLQFDALEQMLVLVLGKQLPTFDRLKDSVERMTRRSFDATRLGQIRTLYPGCYALRWVPKSSVPVAPASRHATSGGVGGGISSGHLLLVEPRLLQAGGAASAPKMSPQQQLERRAEFALRLYRYVAEQHRRFLLDRGADASKLPALMSLSRWHPDFPLERVPAPAAAPAPPAPEAVADSARVTTARQALDQLRPALPDRLQRALEAAVTAAAAASPAASSPDSGGNGKPKSKPPTGIDADLLARIRRRDAEATARRLLTRREPAVEAELRLLDKAPAAARALKIQCQADKRRAVPMSEAAERLARSQPGRLSESEADNLLRLLCRLCPAWASLIDLPSRPGQFIRVQTVGGNFDAVLAAIESRRAELEAAAS